MRARPPGQARSPTCPRDCLFTRSPEGGTKVSNTEASHRQRKRVTNTTISTGCETQKVEARHVTVRVHQSSRRVMCVMGHVRDVKRSHESIDSAEDSLGQVVLQHASDCVHESYQASDAESQCRLAPGTPGGGCDRIKGASFSRRELFTGVGKINAGRKVKACWVMFGRRARRGDIGGMQGAQRCRQWCQPLSL